MVRNYYPVSPKALELVMERLARHDNKTPQEQLKILSTLCAKQYPEKPGAARELYNVCVSRDASLSKLRLKTITKALEHDVTYWTKCIKCGDDRSPKSETELCQYCIDEAEVAAARQREKEERIAHEKSVLASWLKVPWASTSEKQL